MREAAASGRRSRPIELCSVLCLVLALVGTAVAGGPPAVPLPADIVIAPPAPDVPPDVRRFLGVWAKGAWDGVVPHVLVVERVDAARRTPPPAHRRQAGMT